MPFGSPVVPDEKRIHSGWSNVDRCCRELRTVGRRGELGCHDGGAQRRQTGLQRGDLVALVVCLAAELVALGRHQYDRFELTEPVQRRLGRVVLPAGAPDRTDARSGQERDHRLGDVRQITDHPVARRDAKGLQSLRECGGAAQQFGPRHLRRRAAFGDVEDRGTVGTCVAHHLVDIVQPGTGEPRRAGHPFVIEHDFRPVAEVEVVPHRRPERGRIVGRPLPQRPIVRIPGRRCAPAQNARNR